MKKQLAGVIMHGLMLTAIALPGVVAAAGAEWRPERVVEIIVATGAGGGQDRSARTVHRILQEGRILPVQAAVVNKPGGGGLVAWTYLNQRGNDGHFIAIANPTLLTNHITSRSNTNYTDLTMIANLFTESVTISVRAESPLRSIRDLADLLRKDPAAVSFSVGSSLGSANHIAMARLARLAGSDPRKLRAVVFQGGGQAMTALLGGLVDLMASAANNVVPHLQGGKLRVLGVTSDKRLEGSFAAVPTLREQGFPVVINNGRLMVGPKAMTPQQLAYWESALARMVATPEWKKNLDDNEFEPLFMRSRETTAYLKAQHAELKKALADLGMAAP
ncbi:MAG: tripartite tricarboxylate transporter substrate binding protein [Betaproteobacteria bacterium]|nr:tripartite tricarboxylate transporter substrate binding protein [Betaproteobacteria bacterium]